MKTKRFAMVALVACVLLFVTHEALAFYNPQTGRWLSRDPVVEKGGINLYGFVDNRPVDWVDSDGRSIRRGDDGPPVPPPTNPDPAAIDCSGYKSFPAGQKCLTCVGFRKDTYPQDAGKVCEGFKEMYTGSSMHAQAACVAQCLISAEAFCEKFPLCSLRNCCRLAAHVACYAKCGFVPYKGLPPGGVEVGAGDLYPSCISIGIPPIPFPGF